MVRLRFLAAFVFSALLASCFNPVHDDAVDALGPEINGIRPGPRHRAGQPCLVCHGGLGPGSPEMSVGGTVYLARGGTEAASDVAVLLTDAKGATRTLASNDVGNFYVWKSDWDPAFPLSVSVSRGSDQQKMESVIGRDGACATCHRGQGDATHMPAVFLRSR